MRKEKTPFERGNMVLDALMNPRVARGLSSEYHNCTACVSLGMTRTLNVTDWNEPAAGTHDSLSGGELWQFAAGRATTSMSLSP
jgi:hypothetical protein